MGAQAVTPWWSYATRWERRVIPLALAAGIAASAALWSTPSASTSQSASASELATAVANGTPAEDAASQLSALDHQRSGPRRENAGMTSGRVRAGFVIALIVVCSALAGAAVERIVFQRALRTSHFRRARSPPGADSPSRMPVVAAISWIV